MLAICGIGSAIAQEVLARAPILRAETVAFRLSEDPTPPAHRYLFTCGLLEGLSAAEHCMESAAKCLDANYLGIVRSVDQIMATNEAARVVVIGSESGFAGSYDPVYAAAKAGLHLYIETKRLKPEQQLVAISPGIIEDCGMTLRRKDIKTLEARRQAHPKRRFPTAGDVADLAVFLLYQSSGYISGTVIRMNGGENTWR